MAIHLPESCRGVTAGALREVKQRGITSSSGGLVSMKHARAMAADPSTYANKVEPLGRYMSNLEQAQKSIETTIDSVVASGRRLVESATEANKGLVETSRKLRDSTDKLQAQMEKFSTTFSNAKIVEQAKAAQSLADAMERLATLEERGLLGKVFAALK